MCIFGYAEEGKIFSERYPSFFEKLPNLVDTMNKVFTRVFDSRGPADHIVYRLGRICADEDFCEILLLCQNGYGFGGLKLLRGFYERIVTTAYISKNTNEAEAFIDYNAIHERRGLCHAKEAGVDVSTYKSDIEDIERRYKTVKDRYPSPQQSWSKLDIASMAKKTDREILQALYWVCYYLPTMHGHATLYSIIQRLNAAGEAGADYVISDRSAQREMVDTTLRNTHVLMLINLEIQNAFFDLKLDEEVKARLDDFKECWKEVL